MDYQQTLDWLFTQLPMYQRVGGAAYKANLSNALALDAYLKNPHKAFKIIHVAGTNGKGSTCHMLASILQEAGYKVGLYTSPHLIDFRERIRVNGAMVPQQYVVDFVFKHKHFFKDQQLSFFEMTVGMAFDYFKSEQIDIAVIETGLGGRLDSTNIVKPLVSVITNIDMDHTAILGNTLVKIAMEKAGIIKNNAPVIVGEKRAWLLSRFRESALLKNAPFYQVDHRATALPTDLKGVYQVSNVRTTQKTVDVLTEMCGLKITKEHLRTGLLNVVANTGLRGRYELLQENPRVIVETAHNPAGIALLKEALELENYDKLHIVMGVAADKDLKTIMGLLPVDAYYHLAKPDVPRGMPVEQLSAAFAALDFAHAVYSSVPQALDAAKAMAKESDLIIVTGSIFTVAEVL